MFALPGAVRDRGNRGLLLAYPEKIMNANDSTKHKVEIYTLFWPPLMHVNKILCCQHG